MGMKKTLLSAGWVSKLIDTQPYLRDGHLSSANYRGLSYRMRSDRIIQPSMLLRTATP